MRSRGPVIKNSEENTHFRLATAALGRIVPEQPDDLLCPTTPLEAGMDECPPGVDSASVKADPSNTRSPLATGAPSPAREQAQDEGELSHLASCCGQ